MIWQLQSLLHPGLGHGMQILPGMQWHMPQPAAWHACFERSSDVLCARMLGGVCSKC